MEDRSVLLGSRNDWGSLRWMSGRMRIRGTSCDHRLEADATYLSTGPAISSPLVVRIWKWWMPTFCPSL